ncbi:MAG: GxxExxY protein [Chloroflexi bacterium]|jgi:GxxExxY protein|nr:GxxExxY protein [Chloroflexota bacterium]
MTSTTSEIVEKELSYIVMQAAHAVHNSLGPGFLESIYERALAIELQLLGHAIEQQRIVKVSYRDQIVGEHRIDLVVDGKIILELKAVSEIIPIHKQQALSYLRATRMPLAIVINFGVRRVQAARVVNTKRD